MDITTSTISLIFLGILNVCNSSPILDNISNLPAEKSKEIHLYMNVSQDPCENFYEFACGNWPTIYAASKEQKKISYSTIGAKKYEQKMAEFLLSSDNDDTEELKTMKTFYLSCMNRSLNPKDYRSKLMEIVREFAKIHILQKGEESELASKYNWMEIVGEIAHKYNINIFLGFSIRPDLNNRSVNTLILRHFEYPLGNIAYYLNASNEKYRNEYRKEIAQDLIDFFSAEPSLAEESAQNILDFEIQLIKGADNDTIPGGEMTAITNVEELQKRYAQRLDIKKLLETSLGSLPLNIKISERAPSYQENLIKLLKECPAEKKISFFLYHMLRPFIVHMRKPKLSLQDSCIQSVRRNFYYLIENTMYHRMNVPQYEKDIQKFFADIKRQFQRNFQSDKYSWITEDTRVNAVKKLEDLTLELDTFDYINLTQFYGGIHMEPNDFLANLKAKFSKDAEVLRAQLNLAPIPYFPPRIEEGPRYSLYLNRIYLPLVKLTDNHYWSSHFPSVVNYAQLGVKLAHEIIHCFDAKGQHYGVSGITGNWWDKKSRCVFEDRTQCLANQYKSYTYDGKHLAADKDQTENIADNGAIQLAYKSYMAWLEGTEDEAETLKNEMLPNMNYTIPQLFFTIYAQQYCTDVYPFYRDEIINTDLHAPSSLRVIGSLRNFETFSNAFKCSKESRMHPTVKCEIF